MSIKMLQNDFTSHINVTGSIPFRDTAYPVKQKHFTLHLSSRSFLRFF